MTKMRMSYAIILVVLAVGMGHASAQMVGDAPAPSKMFSWPKAFFEAARQGWAESRGNFYECSQKLLEEKKVRRLSWREQSLFLAECRKEGAPVAAEGSSALSNVRAWTQQRWAAAKASWQNDRARFSECSKELREVSKLKRLSLHDERDFLYQCMDERP